MSIANALGLTNEQFMKMVEGGTMENKVKHICQYNEKCKIVESCTTAIEITTFDDASNNIRRYIKGIGECEVENESNTKRQYIRNEQKTVPVRSGYCKEICKDGNLCSRERWNGRNEERNLWQ